MVAIAIRGNRDLFLVAMASVCWRITKPLCQSRRVYAPRFCASGRISRGSRDQRARQQHPP